MNDKVLAFMSSLTILVVAFGCGYSVATKSGPGIIVFGFLAILLDMVLIAGGDWRGNVKDE